MKRILVTIIGLCVFISHTASANIVFLWVTDTAQQFDVYVGGSGPAVGMTGYGGWIGTLYSPSGYWTLSTQNDFEPRNDFRPGWLEIHNGATVTYNGAVPAGNLHTFAQTQAYADLLPAVAPVQDGAAWQQIPGSAQPYWFQGGGSTITITSIPNPSDPTTWNFNAHYFGTVPEPGSASLGLLAIGIFALRAATRRR
jgi:hypothetical protein